MRIDSLLKEVTVFKVISLWNYLRKSTERSDLSSENPPQTPNPGTIPENLFFFPCGLQGQRG